MVCDRMGRGVWFGRLCSFGRIALCVCAQRRGRESEVAGDLFHGRGQCGQRSGEVALAIRLQHAAAGVSRWHQGPLSGDAGCVTLIIIEAVVHAEGAMHEAVQAWAKLRGCCMSWPLARRDRRRLWWPTCAFNTIASHPAGLPAAIRGACVHRLRTLASSVPLVSCSAMVFRPDASCPITLGNNGAHP